MDHCNLTDAEEEAEVFLDTRDEVSSVFLSCAGSPGPALQDLDPVDARLRVCTGDLRSVLERREKFIRSIGLDPANLDSELKLDDEILPEMDGLSSSENESSMLNWSTEQPPSTSSDSVSDNNSAAEPSKDGDRKVGSSSSILQRLMHRENDRSLKSSKKIERRIGWLQRLGIGACIADQGGDEASTSFSDCERRSRGSKFERVKVRLHRKQSKELSALYRGQVIKAHEGAILTMKFSPDGRYLASGGEDGVVRVWCVMQSEQADKHEIPTNDPSCLYLKVEDNLKLAPVHKNNEKKCKADSMKRSMESACVVVPQMVFQISEEPLHEFYGHSGDVLDLSWSNNKQLLSSSVDKTVRLWEVGCDDCLKVFRHSNYVTCVQFNPADERYFISGSIDGKIRVWEIPGCRVVDWVDVREMITAICYRLDGKGVVVGTIIGNCRFYDSLDNQLQLEAQISLTGKKKSSAKRVTGFQFCPSDPKKLMVTSAGSKIRILDGVDVIQTYNGPRSCSSQLSASFTPNGQQIISASEDSSIYVWNRNNQDELELTQTKTTLSCEHFRVDSVSIAIPWNGSRPINPLSAASKKSLEDAVRDKTDSFCSSSPGMLALNHEFVSELHCKASATWPEEMLPSCFIGATALDESQYKFLRMCCQSEPPHSWGQVIVTAGWDGQIRSFHNYGLPLHS